jgi:hypothetical protein
VHIKLSVLFQFFHETLPFFEVFAVLLLGDLVFQITETSGFFIMMFFIIPGTGGSLIPIPPIPGQKKLSEKI